MCGRVKQVTAGKTIIAGQEKKTVGFVLPSGLFVFHYFGRINSVNTRIFMSAVLEQYSKPRFSLRIQATAYRF